MELQTTGSDRRGASLKTSKLPHRILTGGADTSSGRLGVEFGESATESANSNPSSSHPNRFAAASPLPPQEDLPHACDSVPVLSMSRLRLQVRPPKAHKVEFPTLTDNLQNEDFLLSSSTSLPAPRDPERPLLVSYDELPDWYKDNELIHHKYRPVSNSYASCAASWLYMHNETVNIYTHAIPAVIFLAGEGLILGYFRRKYPQAEIIDIAIFAFFILTATICLALSATYHTLMNHSYEVSDLYLRLDFVGIIILTLGDFVSGIHMVFHCEPKLRWTYWGMITCFACVTIAILINPKFQGRRWRIFRVAIFVSTGLSGFAPLTHGIIIFGFKQMILQSGILYYLGEGVLLTMGAIFYATRFPESFRPGRYDLYGCSHQIFHILVVLATIVHLVGILEAFNYNHHNRICSVH